MDPILITGAAGFAGSHLLDRLQGGPPVIAWRRRGGTPPSRATDVTWQEVDLLDRGGVIDAIGAIRPAAVYHLAGFSRVDTAWSAVTPHLQTNVMGTHHVLEGVRRHAPACRVLVVSSALVYDTSRPPLDESAPLRPATPYGRSKLAQDQLGLRAAHDDGLDVVVARPFNHIGPGQRPGFSAPDFARQIALIEAGRAEPVMRVGNLDAKRDLLDVRDTVDAYVHLAQAGVAGRAYNVCSSRAVRIGDVLQSLLSFAHTPIRVVVDPARLRPLDTPLIEGSAGPLRELGWTPRFQLEDTLRDTLDWWRAEIQRELR